MKQVLVIGGAGRIGQSVAADLLAYSSSEVIITGRHLSAGEQVARRLGVKFLRLELADQPGLAQAIARADLVIHCAGPFLHRDSRVLKTCLQQQVNYLDVSDHRSFTIQSLDHRAAAEQAGITAVVNTGIFPGISNSMVRRDVEALDRADQIHLSYVVAGSGGAGQTVMKTTFLGLQHPFPVWRQGEWQTVMPYSDREIVKFPPPYGAPVYWFDMPEAYTLPQAFPAVQTVVTKFGSLPDVYNHITWAIAHKLPKTWLQNAAVQNFLAWGSYTTTQVSDRWSGVGVAICSQVEGVKNSQPATVSSNLFLPDTAIAAGYGTGSLAQLLLTGELNQPGVWTVEEVLPTALFERVMGQRNVTINQVINLRTQIRGSLPDSL
jgi:saccharopine dehydrogenase-like NADP-dependent oxidoreductase